MKLSRHHLIALVIAAAGLGLAFNWLVLGYCPGLGMTVFIGLILAGFWSLTWYLGVRPNRAARWLALATAVFAAIIAVRASGVLILMNLAMCWLLLLLMARTAFRRRLVSLRTSELVGLVWLPAKFVIPGYDVLVRQLIAPVAGDRRWGRVMIGIALTLPILIIFTALFASADLVVQAYIARVSSRSVDPETIGRMTAAGLVGLGFVGGFGYVFGRRSDEPERSDEPAEGWLGRLESGILLGSINALFLGFIVIQAAYLFGGAAALARLNLTYAEYARKGFFELVTVAALTFVILWLADRYVIRNGPSHHRAFTCLALALVGQVIVIMGSAFWRLYLYEQAYGFTALRFYAHAATVLLAILMVILAVKIVRSSPSRTFAFPALLSLIVFVAVLNMVNPDAFIARENLERYQETGKIDVDYLGRLSDDATHVLQRGNGLDAAQKRQLKMDRYDHDATVNGRPDWRSWNYGREATW